MASSDRSCWPLLGFALLLAGASPAEEDTQSKTVLGPRNPPLAEGAQAMLAGDFEQGVRLTLVGLQMSTGPRDDKAAHSNLCAGYLVLRQLETALEHCNWVLERDDRHWRSYNNRALVYLALGRHAESEADIRRGQALNPRSETLKEVRGRYLDEVAPVSENISIDDRRSEAGEPSP